MAKVKVTFNRVYFKDRLRVPKARFEATIERGYRWRNRIRTLTDNKNYPVDFTDKVVKLGDADPAVWGHQFEVPEGAIIYIEFRPTAVEPSYQAAMKLRMKMKALGPPPAPPVLTNLGGWVRHLRVPSSLRRFLTETEHYVLDWQVDRLDGGGPQLPDQVDVLRLHRQHNGRGTISGTRDHPIVEFHPIVPVPEIGLKGPILSKAKRILRLRCRWGVDWNSDLKYPINVNDMSPLNVFPNPAAIPVLDPNDADASTCARIEFTRYSPASMHFQDNDPHLEWDYVSLDGKSKIEFSGEDDKKDKGLKVKVYGTNEGEVELRVRHCPGNGGQKHYVGWYRALVKRIRQIPYRVNILGGPNRSDKPRCTITDIRAHVRIANRFLRQMAVQLRLDQDDAVTTTHGPHGWVDKRYVHPVDGHPGYFRIEVPRGWTRNVGSQGNKPLGTFINYKPGVLNIVYVKNIDPAVIALRKKDWTSGQAVSWPANRAGKFIYDAPPGGSVAWGLPYGRGYGAPPEVQRLKLAEGSKGPANHEKCYTVFLSDLMGNPRTKRYGYGVTLAHEVGHCLDLEHRRELKWQGMRHKPSPDNLEYPRLENVMYYRGWSMSQDFDIIQTKAVHQSPLVHD